jgi:DNA-binding beta-propeller fold protein YncE
MTCPREAVHAAALVLLLTAVPAAAEMILPPGFTTRVYVTGQRFGRVGEPDVRGIPSSSTLAVDGAGVLYIARTARRYGGGETEDLSPIYRIPVGGARLTPETEARFIHGPPLINAQVGAVRPDGQVLVTTYDRDRKIGVLYRMVDGRAELFAGGTPERGVAPLLRQPEGVAIDAGGNVYVADREQGVVVKLDPTGRVLDPRFLALTRPRLMALDDRQRLFIGGDEDATVPSQRSPGVVWRVEPDGSRVAALRGPLAAGLVAGPEGRMFVADRQAAKIIVLDADGTASEFARFTDGDAPRGMAFVPDTPATRRAGIAGDLLVIAISRGRWPVNEVIRVSGPFGAPGAAVR